MLRLSRMVLALAICCGTRGHAQITSDSIITSFAGAVYRFPGDGARATDAPISQVSSLHTDLNGNIIFADSGNHVVSRLNSDGTLSVIAGNGVRGYSGDGGPALRASLNNPLDALFDSRGNLYITDEFNDRVRLVTPDGAISTFYAGPGSYQSLAIDANDNLYFTDFSSCRIYRETPDGSVTIFAGTGICGHSGDGGPATAAMIWPGRGGLAFDAAGNLYLAEASGHYIREIGADGAISTIAGTGKKGYSGDGGPAISAALNVPNSMVFDPVGDLIFTDQDNAVVRQISPDGTITTIAGRTPSGFSGDGGPASQAQFFIPQGLAIDGSGNLYVSDSGNFRIRAIQAGVIQTVAGNAQFRVVPDGTPAARALIFGPENLATDLDGNLFLSELAASKVARIAPDGTFSVLAGTGASGFGGVGGPAKSAKIAAPRALVSDFSGGVFFTDSSAGVVYWLQSDGTLNRIAGQFFNPGYSGDNGSAFDSQLIAPYGIAFGPAGIFVADRGAHVIRRIVIGSSSTITTFAGTGVPGFTCDNCPATSSALNQPVGIALDSRGNLLICDSGNNRIRKVTPDGIITTIAGDGQPRTSGDGGPATQASLYQPFVLAPDSFGNIYFLEAFGTVLRRLDTSGIISTIAGVPFLQLNGAEGVPAGLTLLDAAGLAFDPAGNLYLSSYNTDRIRVIPAAPPVFTTSTSSLKFGGVSGGAPADTQTVAVSSSYPTTFISVSSDSPWLKAQSNLGFTFSFTPARIQVIADPGSLTAGTYQGNLSLAISGASNPFATIPVTFTVAAPAPARLAVAPGSLELSFTQGGAAQTRSFQVSNAGSNSLNFSVTVAGATAGAISLSATAGTAKAGSPATVVATVNPGAASAGTYTANLKVTSSTTGEGANIPVTISIAPRPQRMAVSQRGLLFTAVQGGGVTPPQTLTVLNVGTGSFPWTASAVLLAGGPPWLKVTPNAGTSAAGSASGTVTVSADPSQLPPGTYYGLARIASQVAANAPQDVEIVLNILSPENSPGSLITPGGLTFTTTPNANPSSQSFTITNLNAAPLQFSVTAGTVDTGPWLKAAPDTTATPIAPGGSQVITVQPDVIGAGLGIGVYSGSLIVQFAGVTREVTVRLIVAGAAGKAGARAEAGCAPTQLLPEFTSSVLSDFVLPAAWPIPLEAKVHDDCGAPQTSGRVTVNPSNGDQPLALTSLNDGRWTGTMWGLNARAAQLTMNLVADSDNPKLHGAAPYTGTLVPDDRVPQVAATGVASAGPASPQGPVAPGSIISITGANFIASPSSASRLPLDTVLGGTQVLMAGRFLPLIYSGGGLISALVPYDVDVNGQFSLLVIRGGVFSGPQTVAIGSAQPAILLVDGANDPAVPANLWKQFTAGTGIDAAKIAPANPVKAGDKLIVYCTGLGTVNGTVDVAAAAPADPSPVMNPVSVTIGGVAAPAPSARLAPGVTGIYQVSVAVPAGIAPGDAVPLVVSTMGQSSAAVNLSVR